MHIITPLSKKTGKKKIALLTVAALSALACAFWAGAVIFRAPGAPAPVVPTKLETIETELERLLGSMDQAEELADRAMYLEIARKAAVKNIEADDEWKKMNSGVEGLRYGLEHGIFEEYIHRFTDKDKYEMLAARHGMTPEALRLFKSELEMVFFDDYAQKFGHAYHESAPAETAAPAES